MECAEAVFHAISTKWLADTGTGGLSNTASAAYVREFRREGDPKLRQVDGWPKVTVRIRSEDISPFPGSTETKALFDAVVTFIVETDRDVENMATSSTARKMDRIASRIRQVFNNGTLANVTDTDETSPQRTWTFRPSWRLTPVDVPSQSPTGKSLIRAFPYRVSTTKESA